MSQVSLRENLEEVSWNLRVVAACGLLEFEVGLQVGLCWFAVEVRSEFNHERMMIE